VERHRECRMVLDAVGSRGMSLQWPRASSNAAVNSNTVKTCSRGSHCQYAAAHARLSTQQERAVRRIERRQGSCWHGISTRRHSEYRTLRCSGRIKLTRMCAPLNAKPAAMYCAGFEGFAMQLHHVFLAWALGAFLRVRPISGSAIVLNSPHPFRIYQEIDKITLKQR
jgi:hypothetical protein